ncbi:MAG: SufE family protein [Bdellovibrionaceae bacterium]|nr:SufE family protein [Pseudobdellovibrionaceae bacterium]
MSLIADRQKQIVDKFQGLTDWEDRYKRIIAMGRELRDMPEEMKTEDNKVKGCQSQVWLFAELDSQGLMHIHGDSDAMIVKGLVALLLRMYSGTNPAEILQTPPEFLRELGFEGHLSPSRANGLHAMLKQIRNYATAFAYVLKSKSTT